MCAYMSHLYTSNIIYINNINKDSWPPQANKHMKRKIIKQAGQAYTVTLPINWVRSFALDTKTEIDIEQKGNQ